MPVCPPGTRNQAGSLSLGLTQGVVGGAKLGHVKGSVCNLKVRNKILKREKKSFEMQKVNSDSVINIQSLPLNQIHIKAEEL